MTATPAAASHMHPGGIDHYHEIASARELRLHVFYGHDDSAPASAPATWAERHRQAHAGDEAIARCAQLGEAFAGVGRTDPGGVPLSAAAAPSGQSSEGGDRQGATPAGPCPGPPSGPLDPAARIARAVMAAIAGVRLRPASDLPAIEAELARAVREALGSYK